MFDCLFLFAALSAAQADPAVGRYWQAPPAPEVGDWDRSVVNAPLQAWADSGDAIVTATGEDGSTFPVTVHAYLPGYLLSISLASRSAALEASPGLILCAARDAANAGADRAQYIVAVGPGQTLAGFAGMHVSPLMAGARYFQ